MRTRKVLKSQEVSRSPEPGVTGDSLSQVLADLITKQGLSPGEQVRAAATPEPQVSLLNELPSETPAVAETEQVDPIDLSRQGREAEEPEETHEEIIQETNDLWAEFFKPN